MRITTSAVTIDIDGRAEVEVAPDGEVERVETPLRYRSLEGELSVLVPAGLNTDER